MTRIVLAFMLVFAFQCTFADVLIIDEVRQADRMELPKNGQSKVNVETGHGAPLEKNAAVGDPPISNWKYEAFTVYFEYDLVLSTVLHPGAVIDK